MRFSSLLRHISITALLILVAASAWGRGRFVHGTPGAACTPSNEFQETHFEYVDHYLLNTGSDPFDLFTAVCPVSEIERSATVEEVRVLVLDLEQRDAWCRMVDALGEEIGFAWVDFSSSARGRADFAPPPWGTEGLLEATFHCLLHPGASVERVEVVWEDR